ncbi:MAG: cell division protein FtsZ [Rhodospirillales bacterium]
MSINLSIPKPEQENELKPRLTVMGIGGAGGNAVNNMIASELEGVEFVVANTDAQALGLSKAVTTIQLGAGVTQGLGAGSKPEVGRAAAEETLDDILGLIQGSHMLFIAAGMGGGTGTGAAPVIAKAAREHGILTVGVVTKPFHFEGVHRMRLAEAGIQELEQYVDTLIIIPNQNLFRVANEKTTFADAFSMADRVLYSGVRGVTDLMVMPGLINLDFADVRSVMSEMGKAMMGTGEAEGETRAIDAAEAAISNPLLDDTSMQGAKGVLINITGGMDMTLFEVDEAAERIRKEVDSEAYIIFGSTFDESMDGRMRVSVVATGIDAGMVKQPLPPMMRLADKVAAAKPQAVPAPQAASPAPSATPAVAQTQPQIQAKPENAEPAKQWAPVVSAQPAGKAKTVTVSIKPEAKPAEQAAAQAASQEDGADAPKPVRTATATVKPAPKPAPAAESRKPAAMPSANASDAYIPPAPVERETGEVQKSPDPFAVAAMANGARKDEAHGGIRPHNVEVKATGTDDLTAETMPAPKKKGPSLFERVTGTGRARQAEAKAATTVMKPAPAASATITPHPAAESAAKSAAAADAASDESQRELGGMNPADRLVSAPEDEDLLDIPAFLRRQAN